jgi:hypothetical protein
MRIPEGGSTARDMVKQVLKQLGRGSAHHPVPNRVVGLITCARGAIDQIVSVLEDPDWADPTHRINP